uniref:Uncharacterized protein n=1 Tax=Glossina pallidipes TaxID=7398 RepID=A0A1B0AIR4_GLOPL
MKKQHEKLFDLYVLFARHLFNEQISETSEQGIEDSFQLIRDKKRNFFLLLKDFRPITSKSYSIQSDEEKLPSRAECSGNLWQQPSSQVLKVFAKKLKLVSEELQPTIITRYLQQYPIRGVHECGKSYLGLRCTSLAVVRNDPLSV